MNFANLHQNFILLSPLTLNQHLDSHGFWPAFIAEATPFARNIKGTPRINAGQFDGGKAIKHGRLSWRDETLQKLADNYHRSTRPDTFHFDFFSAEFPSPAACAKQNTTPALTLKLTGIYGFSHSGLLLSFRQDHFDELGETAVNASLNRLTTLLQTTLRLKKTTAIRLPLQRQHPRRMDKLHHGLIPRRCRRTKQRRLDNQRRICRLGKILNISR